MQNDQIPEKFTCAISCEPSKQLFYTLGTDSRQRYELESIVNTVKRHITNFPHEPPIDPFTRIPFDTVVLDTRLENEVTRFLQKHPEKQSEFKPETPIKLLSLQIRSLPTRHTFFQRFKSNFTSNPSSAATLSLACLLDVMTYFFLTISSRFNSELSESKTCTILTFFLTFTASLLLSHILVSSCRAGTGYGNLRIITNRLPNYKDPEEEQEVAHSVINMPHN